jgi:hypothetical protein
LLLSKIGTVFKGEVMPKKDKRPSALEVSKVSDDNPQSAKSEIDEPTAGGPPDGQLHRAGKPSNPFLVRHPPPRLGDERKGPGRKRSKI